MIYSLYPLLKVVSGISLHPSNQRDLIVTLQLNVCQLEDPHRLEITTHILGYQEDNIIGDEAQFIPLAAIRHVDYQTN